MTDVKGDRVWVRFCHTMDNEGIAVDQPLPLDRVRPWDVGGDSRALRYKHFPQRAPLDLQASEFRAGEEVVLLNTYPSGARARVIGADGEKVAVRWDDARKNDESFAPSQIRLVYWGPFDRLDPVSQALVPRTSETFGAAPNGTTYAVGQRVDVMFRGVWTPAFVAGVQKDDYIVSVASSNAMTVVKAGRVRLGLEGGDSPFGGTTASLTQTTLTTEARMAELRVQADTRTAEMTRLSGMASMPPMYYRPEDNVETQIRGRWVPGKVKRVDGIKIILYPSEPGGEEVAYLGSDVRIKRELMQQRTEERMATIRAGRSKPLTQGRDGLAAADCRPGMIVVPRESGPGGRGDARITRVEGDQVFMVLLNNGKGELSRPVDTLASIMGDRSKPAREYKAGERVYVRWTEAPAWAICRVERIEGDKIILRWGQVPDTAEVLRTLTADDVRPMMMAADEKVPK